jgi:hypothetical protein
MEPAPDTLRLPVPDMDFRLAAEDRAAVLTCFDADALERLLQMVRPDMRREILRFFQPRQEGEHLGHLAEFYDADLQVVLEEVWAPMWDDEPDEAIEENWYGLPGRDAARRRREARRRESGSE